MDEALAHLAVFIVEKYLFLCRVAHPIGDLQCQIFAVFMNGGKKVSKNTKRLWWNQQTWCNRFDVSKLINKLFFRLARPPSETIKLAKVSLIYASRDQRCIFEWAFVLVSFMRPTRLNSAPDDGCFNSSTNSWWAISVQLSSFIHYELVSSLDNVSIVTHFTSNGSFKLFTRRLQWEFE